jgi:glycosyltransferase involved in cell wall biosynthesis
MHILFLTDNFPPEVNAPASRTFEHCREWVTAGHKVTVITCVPNFPTGKVFAGYRNQLWQSEKMDGITVVRVWTYITRNEGFAKRIFDYLSFMAAAFLAALFVRGVDVIVGTSPQFFTACAAYATAKCKRRPWIFELRDIWPESIRAVSAMNHSWALDFLEKVEMFLYRRATAIVTVTNAFRENLVRRGIDGQKIKVVTNGADTVRFSASARDHALAAQLGLQGKFVAGYIGTHGMAHALDTLIEAAQILRDEVPVSPVHLLLLGDGAERVSLQRRASGLGLDNILFLDSVSKGDVVRYWSLLDVTIVHLKKSELFKTVIPSKIFEAMAMGIPILHGVEGESADIIRDTGAGWVFEPENARELTDWLLTLVNDDRLRSSVALKGPVAVKNYDRRVLAERMLAILKEVANAV